MIATWMVYSVLIASLLMLVASLLERVELTAGRSSRVLWLLAMGATVTLSVVVLFKGAPSAADPLASDTPGAVTTSPVVAGVPASANFAYSQQTDIPVENVSPAPVPPVSSVASAPASFQPFRSFTGWMSERREFTTTDRLLLLIWGAMSAVSLFFMLASLVRLNRRRGAWQRASFGGTPILVTDGVGPAVVGIVKGEIAVPRWLFDLDASSQRLIIEHEKQHLAARDQLAMMGGLLSLAALPWNPVLWLMLPRLRRGTEMDCDARVLRGAAKADAREYATLLVDIGARAYPRALASHALSDSPTDLEHRVTHILSRAKRLTGWGVLTRAGASAALVLAACIAPKPVVAIGANEATPVVNSVQGTVVNAEPQVVTNVAAAETAVITNVLPEVSAGSVAIATVSQTAASRADLAAVAVTRVAEATNTATELAQDGRIRGTVASDLPQPGARVLLLGDSSRIIDSATTGTNGEFSFAVPQTGLYYRLHVTKPPYAEVLTPAFEVQSRATVALRIDLSVLVPSRGGGRGGMAMPAGRPGVAPSAVPARGGVSGGGRGGASLARAVGSLDSALRRIDSVSGRSGGGRGGGGRGAGGPPAVPPPSRIGGIDSARGRPASALYGGRGGGSAAAGAIGVRQPGARGAAQGGYMPLVVESGNQRVIYGAFTFGNPPRRMNTDSLVQLVGARYPQLFSDTTNSSDSLLVALVLDSQGTVTHTRMLPHIYATTADDGVSIAEYSDSTSSMRGTRNVILRELFPDLSGRPLAAGGLIKGLVSPRGMRGKKITLLFGVTAPR